ncbi:MAG TPA: hypothetical protein VM328_11185 [Fimbriimonadaceae bacterium]|nr:hypothetical protein [Fimbriimonadaceae bacterium]
MRLWRAFPSIWRIPPKLTLIGSAAALACSATSQGRIFDFDPPVLAPRELLRREYVRAELRLSESERDLVRLPFRLSFRRSDNSLTPQEKAEIAAAERRLDEFLSRLSPDRRKRLRQIQLQHLGVGAIWEKDVQHLLKVTSKQKADLERVLAAHTPGVRSMRVEMPSSLPRWTGEVDALLQLLRKLEQYQEARWRAAHSLLACLSEAQRSAFFKSFGSLSSFHSRTTPIAASEKSVLVDFAVQVELGLTPKQALGLRRPHQPTLLQRSVAYTANASPWEDAAWALWPSLSKAQQARARQIALQRAGARAVLDAAIARELGIGHLQYIRIAQALQVESRRIELQVQRLSASSYPPPTSPGRSGSASAKERYRALYQRHEHDRVRRLKANAAQIQRLNDSLNKMDQVLARHLTASQLKKWKLMLGPSFVPNLLPAGL